MATLLNFMDQNADTLQQMALLGKKRSNHEIWVIFHFTFLTAYIKDPEVGEPFLEAITTYKVSNNLEIVLENALMCKSTGWKSSVEFRI